MASNKEFEKTGKCPLLSTCPFIVESQNEMPELVDRLKKNYCLNNFKVCARKVICEVLGGDNVPTQMMPHQNMWAEQILTDAGKGSHIYQFVPKPRKTKSRPK